MSGRWVTAAEPPGEGKEWEKKREEKEAERVFSWCWLVSDLTAWPAWQRAGNPCIRP